MPGDEDDEPTNAAPQRQPFSEDTTGEPRAVSTLPEALPTTGSKRPTMPALQVAQPEDAGDLSGLPTPDLSSGDDEADLDLPSTVEDPGARERARALFEGRAAWRFEGSRGGAPAGPMGHDAVDPNDDTRVTSPARRQRGRADVPSEVSGLTQPAAPVLDRRPTLEGAERADVSDEPPDDTTVTTLLVDGSSDSARAGDVSDDTHVTAARPTSARAGVAAAVPIDGELRCGFVVLDKLAAGGTGLVYKAQRPSDGAYVALKVLTRASAGDEESRARFEREAFAHRRLLHPNIVKLVDTGVVEGEYFIATELVDGPTLHELIQRAGALPVPVAVAVLVDVLSALSYLHAREIVHRDLKPRNILLSRAGEVKLVDFGFARDERDPDRSAVGSGVGTIEYMSPEQTAGDPLDARSDLFSCATVLFEMLTGRSPFARATPVATMTTVYAADRPSFLEAIPTLPPSLAAVAERLGARLPDDRPASANAVVEDLVELDHALRTAYPDALRDFIADPIGLRARFVEEPFDAEDEGDALPSTVTVPETLSLAAHRQAMEEESNDVASVAASQEKRQPAVGGLPLWLVGLAFAAIFFAGLLVGWLVS
jgi:serine/threonine-protein kinase